MFINAIALIGSKSIQQITATGRFTLFLLTTISRLKKWPFPFTNTINQIAFIGAKTLPVIVVSGLFTGMVVALQFYDTLVRFGSVDLLGSAVALSLIRELGPVMAGLMVIARVGSATCAEIAIMRHEQQFDALDCMAIDSYQFVMLPRLIATLISLPLLTAIFNLIGISGGYIVGVLMQGISEAAFQQGMTETIVWNDVYMSLLKSLIFGLVIIWISMAKGFFMHLDDSAHGAEGVSKMTTQAVVTSAILMLLVDYVISAFLL